MGQFEAAYQSYHSMMNFFGLNQLLCGKHGLVMPIVDTDERRQDRGAFCAKYARRAALLHDPRQVSPAGL